MWVWGLKSHPRKACKGPTYVYVVGACSCKPQVGTAPMLLQLLSNCVTFAIPPSYSGGIGVSGGCLFPAGVSDPDSNFWLALLKALMPGERIGLLLGAKWRPTERWAEKALNEALQEAGFCYGSRPLSPRSVQLLEAAFWKPEIPKNLFVPGRPKVWPLPVVAWVPSPSLCTLGPGPQRLSPHRIILSGLTCVHFSANNKSTREKGTLLSRAFIIRVPMVPGKKKKKTTNFQILLWKPNLI